MLKPTNHMTWTVLFLALGILGMSMSKTVAAGKVWSPGAGLEGNIVFPTSDTQVGVGKSIACTAMGNDPSDSWTRVSPPPLQGTSSGDPVDFTWACSAGTFPNGNTGPTVTWQAPDSLPNSQGTVTISVTIDDIPGGISPADSGTRDDASISRSVEIIVTDVIGVMDFGDQWSGDGPYTLSVTLRVTIVSLDIPAVGDSLSWTIQKVTTDAAGNNIAPDNYASISGDGVTDGNGQAHATLLWNPTDYYDGDRYIWVNATDDSR